MEPALRRPRHKLRMLILNGRLRRVAWVWMLAAVLGAARERNQPDEYAVLLSEPPVGLRLSRPQRGPTGRLRAAEPELARLATAVDASQRPVRGAVEKTGVRVTGRTRYLLNALFVDATPQQAERLRALPGVRGVVRMVRYKKLLNASAALVNAPAAWSALGGVSSAGAGLKIGILDSGIDPRHPGLQDPTLTPPPGYPRARPEDLPYTNNKIIVARSYVRTVSSTDPTRSRPDDYSPRDRAGHGTFVAMIAAGRAASASGGPTITGIAPKAFLGNYKIFGSTDINDFTRQRAVLEAMDDAASDDMDILNLSLGGVALYAPNDRGSVCSTDPQAICDPLAEAAKIASEQFGMLIVVAAGNDGDHGNVVPTLNTISSPGTAPAAISVGATTNSRRLTSTLRGGPGAPGSLQSVPALFGNGPRQAITAPIRDVESLGNDGLACSALPAGSLAAVLALIRRGTCDFDVKIGNASAAGASGVVVYNRSGNEEPITMTGLGITTIPSVMVGNTAGVNLRSYIRSTANAAVTLDPQLAARSTTADRVAGFSSRGPSIDLAVKPDVAAPGVALYSATQNSDPNGGEYDPTGFTSLEGSSFSAPHVAGAAALVWQRNRDLTPGQVKSALLHTASADLLDGGSTARGTAVGAGKLNVQAALSPGATLEPGSVSFGALSSGTAFPVTRELRLTNVSSSSDTFRVTVEPRDADPNARVTVNEASSASGTIGAGQNATLRVALTGSLPRPGFYEGVLRVQGTTGRTNLRVPYHYIVGSGTPTGIFPIAGDGLAGTAGEPLPELLILKLVDAFGLPVRDVDVQFRVVAGGGRIVEADARTDRYGIAAADPDLGPELGDQIYTATAAGLTVTFANFARAKPIITAGGVVNGASFARGRTVAPGSIVSIFGSDLAEGAAQATRVPLPMALGRVSVSFDQPDAGVSVPARLFYVSPGQLNVQVPWELAGLTFAMVKVRINDTVSSVVRVELGDYSPGIFEYDLGGQRWGVVTHANDGRVVTPENPARGGETVVVWATGVGPVDPAPASGDAASLQTLAHTRIRPTANVGGQPADVIFSGLAPGFVGLDQLNITIPATARSGVQQLVITSNGIPSSPVNVPIE